MKFLHVIEVQKNKRIIEVFLFMKVPRISLSLKKAEAFFTGRDHIATKKKLSENSSQKMGLHTTKRNGFSLAQCI